MEKSVCLACVSVSLIVCIAMPIDCIVIFYFKTKLRNYDQILTKSSRNYKLNLTKLPCNGQNDC